MKVVLDTNVIIDGFKDEYSYQKRVINEIIAGNIQAFANHQTMRENKLILSQLIDNDEYRAQLNDFFSQLSIVTNRHQIHVVRDPEDNKILESAVEARADYLITNDNDLLQLEKYESVEIVTPATFWVRYKDEGQDLWTQWTNFITRK